jgi:cholesterol transport system auxiliary component
MKILFHVFAVLLVSVLQAGCAIRAPAPVLYDFGPLTIGNGPPPASRLSGTRPHQVRLPALSVAEVQTPAWLDGPMMFYRLSYANIQQPYPYAGSRWSMTPAQLLGQRLKARIAQEGGTVLSPLDGAVQLPVLRLDTDEFIQIFESPTASVVVLSLRASVFQGQRLISQRQFSQQVHATTPDAAGGARALATASDSIITDIISWISDIGLAPSATASSASLAPSKK